MARVVHFEIGVDDMDRAVSFYKNVFEWKIEKWDGPVDYWLVATGDDDKPGINGALQNRREDAPVVNTVDVKDLDEAIARVEKNGGKVTSPRMAVPGVGYMAYCADPEGNPFGMMQADPNAK